MLKCLLGNHFWSSITRSQELQDEGGVCLNCMKRSNKVLGELMLGKNWKERTNG